MPDYLGADQRKVRKEDDKDEKPIQGIIYFFLYASFCISKSWQNMYFVAQIIDKNLMLH